MDRMKLERETWKKKEKRFKLKILKNIKGTIGKISFSRDVNPGRFEEVS